MRIWVVAGLVALVLGAAATASALPQATVARSCGWVDLSPGVVDDNGVTVRAQHISCPAARKEVRRWFGPGGDGPGARGWRCKQMSDVSPYRARCKKGRRVIGYSGV
jgi:hypothetical protein